MPKQLPDINLTFEYQVAQKRVFRWVERKGEQYLMLKAPQILETGGQRSGKTSSKLIYGIQEYCLRYEGCAILVLRRTIKELDEGVIADLHALVDNKIFHFNKSDRVATFQNGSRIVFGGCATGAERDIEKYLGTGYPYILVDECGQFSPSIWHRLRLRNIVNPGCRPDQYGNMPIPCIVGCTNPIGAWWAFYRTVFVKKEPWEKEDGATIMLSCFTRNWRDGGGQLLSFMDSARMRSRSAMFS